MIEFDDNESFVKKCCSINKLRIKPEFISIDCKWGITNLYENIFKQGSNFNNLWVLDNRFIYLLSDICSANRTRRDPIVLIGSPYDKEVTIMLFADQVEISPLHVRENKIELIFEGL